jgi:tripartite-type tricarboxylate transporter receptor subunit TctC
LKDFIPVASLTNQPYVLVAGKPAGITTVRELIAAAKAKPGELKGKTGEEQQGSRQNFQHRLHGL